MPDLPSLLAGTGSGVVLRTGQVVTAGASLAVNVDGSLPVVWWAAGYIPTLGDPVQVLLADGVAVVLGPITGAPRPMTGTVSGAAVSGLLPLDTTVGTVQARYAGTAPSIGTLVFLDWAATVPRVVSTAGSVASVPTDPDATDPDAPAAPPPAADSGYLLVPAIDSATWSSAGAWDSYYRTDLMQGLWSRHYGGAWFYGATPTQLAGRTITRFQVHLPARVRAGNYNAALSLRLYRHTSRTRPAGDVTRVAGPQSVSIPAVGTVIPNGGWVDLPTAWGQDLADSGGGLGIYSTAAGDYGGLVGIGVDPTSGQARFDWTRS